MSKIDVKRLHFHNCMPKMYIQRLKRRVKRTSPLLSEYISTKTNLDFSCVSIALSQTIHFLKLKVSKIDVTTFAWQTQCVIN